MPVMYIRIVWMGMYHRLMLMQMAMGIRHVVRSIMFVSMMFVKDMFMLM